MKKLRIFACLVCILLTLSSCRISNFDTDALLTPPQMNAANQQIQKALAAAVGADYELVYPKSGVYQNAIISVDVNGNGVNEAICFYTAGNEKKVSFTVLENTKNGWAAKSMTGSQSESVDFVDFFDYNGDGAKELVVGWQYLMGDEKALEVFAYNNSNISSVFTGLYSNCTVFESALVLISRNTTGKTATASIIGQKGKELDIVGTASLNSSITSIVGVQSSRINDLYAIFIDEQIENQLYSTEVLTVNPSLELTNISSKITTLTTRKSPVRCMDIDKNGIIDLPVEKAFSSYSISDKTENLYYFEWYGIGQNGELSNLFNAYVGSSEQFIIKLDKKWQDSITVKKDGVNDREIHFFMLGDEGDIPMFSFRIFSQQEFSDEVRALGWLQIAVENENVFAFKPEASDVPKSFLVDFEKFTQIFMLLS